jgi:hypothetical protein
MATARVKIYVVVLYFGSDGDEVSVYATKAEAEAAIMEYAEDHWPDSFGDFPATLDEVSERWECGSFDDRWELEERIVEAEVTEEPVSNV